jgi:hypothetical protein
VRLRTIQVSAKTPGEAHAITLHTGPSVARLRDLADHWHSRAATLDNIAAETSQRASTDADSSDGSQQAGAHTTVQWRQRRESAWIHRVSPRLGTMASRSTRVAQPVDRS